MPNPTQWSEDRKKECLRLMNHPDFKNGTHLKYDKLQEAMGLDSLDEAKRLVNATKHYRYRQTTQHTKGYLQGQARRQANARDKRKVEAALANLANPNANNSNEMVVANNDNEMVVEPGRVNTTLVDFDDKDVTDYLALEREKKELRLSARKAKKSLKDRKIELAREAWENKEMIDQDRRKNVDEKESKYNAIIDGETKEEEDFERQELEHISNMQDMLRTRVAKRKFKNDDNSTVASVPKSVRFNEKIDEYTNDVEEEEDDVFFDANPGFGDVEDVVTAAVARRLFNQDEEDEDDSDNEDSSALLGIAQANLKDDQAFEDDNDDNKENDAPPPVTPTTSRRRSKRTKTPSAKAAAEKKSTPAKETKATRESAKKSATKKSTPAKATKPTRGRQTPKSTTKKAKAATPKFDFTKPAPASLSQKEKKAFLKARAEWATTPKK